MHHKEHNTSCEVAQAALVFPDCLRLFLCQCFILHLVFFFFGDIFAKVSFGDHKTIQCAQNILPQC